MIRKIVVPVDGSDASERILDHVSELFRAADANIRFLHVCDRSEAGMTRGRRYLEELEDRALARFPYVESVLLHGEPAFEILKYSIVQHADLIALMTRTRSTVKKLLFGSTAQELMRSSPVPLFLARPTWNARPIRKILVPLDGSRTSYGVLPVVADLAAGAGARVSLMTVLKDPERRDRADRTIRRAAASFAKRAIPVETVLKPGVVVKEILGSAKDEGADVIALGTHGRRGSDRFFYGSIAESVVQGSEIPLLLRRQVRSIPKRVPAASPA